jgi:hypothetical protein
LNGGLQVVELGSDPGTVLSVVRASAASATIAKTAALTLAEAAPAAALSVAIAHPSPGARALSVRTRSIIEWHDLFPFSYFC